MGLSKSLLDEKFSLYFSPHWIKTAGRCTLSDDRGPSAVFSYSRLCKPSRQRKVRAHRRSCVRSQIKIWLGFCNALPLITSFNVTQCLANPLETSHRTRKSMPSFGWEHSRKR
jgi:hypothetical protein